MVNEDELLDDLQLTLDDLAYHQSRVMMLIALVSANREHSGKLDGLTKLAKLDFLVRYPALAAEVLDDLDPDDPRLHLTAQDKAEPTLVDDPMVRYKYGPWDDRYYPVIGALVSRGLVRYARGRRGSVALVATPAGKALASDLATNALWRDVADRCEAVSEASGGLTGNALKDLIYSRLAALMDRPRRVVIR